MRRVRTVSAAVAIAIFCAPAFSADPLTLLLLRLLRDKIISTGLENAAEYASSLPNTPPPAPSLPGVPFAGFDDAQLRRLIDEGFVHLTSAQRDEVYSGVRRIIADPKHAAEVPAIIADLAIKASAVRQAHEQLNALSFAQKRRIANEAREEYETMPLETREQMASVLRQRLVPLPADLTDMILGEFDRVRAQIVTPPPVALTAPSPSAAAPQTAPAAVPTASAN
jgi:hypothetical protein